MTDDEEGISLARRAATDEEAREHLARRLRPRVRRLAASLLRNPADADDATQTALLEILRAAGSFRGESSLEAWADRIALRTAIRLARERRLASIRTEPALEPDALPCPASGENGALPRSILAYLDELPEVRRTVLVLRHVLGYSVQEIADWTSVSTNTVKDRLLSAREQVRTLVRRDVVNRRLP